jgi:hypothetical protein
MVGTINPVVHGGRRRHYLTALATHGLGLVLSTAATGAALGLGGRIAADGRGRYAVLALLAAWGGLAELGLVPMPRPQSRWQVPGRWRRLTPWQTSFLYGLGLGPGVTVRIATPAFYVLLLGVALLGSIPTAAALFVVYAMGRWLAVLLFAIGPSQPDRSISAALVRASRWQPAARVAIGLVLALCAGIFLALLRSGA